MARQDRIKVMPGVHSWTMRCIVIKWVRGILFRDGFEIKTAYGRYVVS